MINRSKGKKLVKYVPDYIVFDLETTGIRVASDDIIEISAVKVKAGEVVDTFSTLVNPNRKISSAATKVNGITNEMVKDAPVLETALADFLEYIGDSVLVGHNIHSFDMNFVYDAALELFDKEVKNEYIDTLYMARKCLPELSHHRLSDVSDYFNISTEGAHRALNDCIMNQKCYEELGKIQKSMAGTEKEEESKICPECGADMVRRKGKFGEFYGCGNYPNCKHTEKIK